MPHRSARLDGLAPVEGAQCRALVLGSFPGAKSLAAAEYYAHPQNALWRAFECIGVPRSLPYAQRCARLVELRIALWDGIASCLREGSLDSEIREPRYSDLAAFARRHPELRMVLLNGRKAQHAFELASRACGELSGIEIVPLPSTSPANTRRGKLEVWTEALRRALDVEAR